MRDKVILFLAALIAAAGIGGFYYFGEQPDIIRVLILLAGLGIATVVFFLTALGRATKELLRGAMREMRQVVWPERKETMQVTAIVFALVLVTAIFLWGLDRVLLLVVQKITG